MLYLNDNQLSGPIPSHLSYLSGLKELALKNNRLTGPIPSELGNLSQLRELYLNTNELTGLIPPELGNPSRLRILHIDVNQLSGLIPPELGNLTELTELDLYHNRLTGPIPPQLANLTNLTGLALSENQLTGPIPPDIGNLSKLELLYLDQNRLTGILPYSLTQLTDLLLFNFDDNAGLCAPINDAFQEWLYDIDTEGPNCSDSEPLTDRQILEIFYIETDGHHWKNDADWLQYDLPLSDWYGVTTDDQGRVTHLDLRDNGLRGHLPPARTAHRPKGIASLQQPHLRTSTSRARQPLRTYTPPNRTKRPQQLNPRRSSATSPTSHTSESEATTSPERYRTK